MHLKFFVMSLVLVASTAHARDKKSSEPTEAERQKSVNLFKAKSETSEPEETKGTSEPTEAERQKSVNLFKMRDQSGETFYEQKTFLQLGMGFAFILDDVGGKIKNPNESPWGEIALAHRIMPEFTLGGFVSLTRFDADYFGTSNWIISFGVLADYYPVEWFYFGVKSGLGVETLGGSPKVRYILGPHLGCDFRLAERFSLGLEFYSPFYLGTENYNILIPSATFRMWF